MNAQNALVISSRDSNTELSFTGDASALEKLDLGNVGLSMSFTKAVGLDIQGGNGVIGLGLFIVEGWEIKEGKWKWSAGMNYILGWIVHKIVNISSYLLFIMYDR